jgi:purine-binding chemotaxis protein CheW
MESSARARRERDTDGSGMPQELQLVGFRVGKETYGVPIRSVHEIVRVPEITAVPDAPEHVQGVINLRGKIVSVIDLRQRLGEAQAGSSRQNRILVIEYQGRLAGLIVDSASEVLKLSSEQVEPPPSMFQEGALQCVTGMGKYQGRLIILLDLGKLLQAQPVTARSTGSKATAASGGSPG